MEHPPNKRSKTPLDFSKLSLGSLKKYKKAHHVRLKKTSKDNKAELAEAVARHFAQLPAPINEEQVIADFAMAIKVQNRKGKVMKDEAHAQAPSIEKRKKPRSPQK